MRDAAANRSRIREARFNITPLKPDLPDHYATLGLDRRCSASQIRDAYRVLAKRHHPDLNGGSAEAGARCQELNAAHEILSDPRRRRAYDQEVRAREKPAPATFTERIDRNLAHEVRLRLEEFIRGTRVTLHIQDPASPGEPEEYELEIPPETAPGTQFRIPRVGQFAGGTLRVRVRAMPNARFKVKSSDVQTDLRITARRAADGGWETVSGPTGASIRVEVPAGIARGAIVRVAGHGLPRPRGGRGDLLVRIVYRVEVRTARR